MNTKIKKAQTYNERVNAYFLNTYNINIENVANPELAGFLYEKIRTLKRKIKIIDNLLSKYN